LATVAELGDYCGQAIRDVINTKPTKAKTKKDPEFQNYQDQDHKQAH